MCGWFSEASSCASRSNRASRSGSAAYVSGKTLIATSRWRRVSRARYTFYEAGGCQVPWDFSVFFRHQDTRSLRRQSEPLISSGARVGGDALLASSSSIRRRGDRSCAPARWRLPSRRAILASTHLLSVAMHRWHHTPQTSCCGSLEARPSFSPTVSIRRPGLFDGAAHQLVRASAAAPRRHCASGFQGRALRDDAGLDVAPQRDE